MNNFECLNDECRLWVCYRGLLFHCNSQFATQLKWHKDNTFFPFFFFSTNARAYNKIISLNHLMQFTQLFDTNWHFFILYIELIIVWVNHNLTHEIKKLPPTFNWDKKICEKNRILKDLICRSLFNFGRFHRNPDILSNVKI